MKNKKIYCIFALLILIIFSVGLSSSVCAAETDSPSYRIEAIDFDDTARIESGGFISQTKNNRFGFEHSALWQSDIRSYAEYWFKDYQDWSIYDAAVLTLYSNKATGKGVFFRYMSEQNYNVQYIYVNWQGWASVIVPFNDTSREHVAYIRFGTANESDGITGQELTVASVRLIKKGDYNFYDNAFGYEVHDTTTAVLADQAAAVYAGSEYAVVDGARRRIGTGGDRAVKKNGTIMVPLEFIKSIGWDTPKQYITETDIDDKTYVSFAEAAENQKLTSVVSGNLAVAAKENAEIFEGVNKLNPYASCAAHMICSDTVDVLEANADDYSRIRAYMERELLYSNKTDIQQAKRQLEFIRKNKNNPFSDLKFEAAVDVAEAYSRIEQLAFAYASKENAFSGSEEIKNEIIRALDYMYDNHYGKRQTDGTGKAYKGDENTEYINVYIPYHLSNILLLMRDDIPYEARLKYLSPCTKNGIVFADNENTAPICAQAIIGVGAIAQRADIICYGRDKITERLLYSDYERSQNSEPFLALEAEIHTPLSERRVEELPAYVRANMHKYGGQGIMSDGSYISGGAHGENVSAGMKLLDITSLAAALSDTPFALDAAAGSAVFQILKNGYYPFVYNGMALRIVAGNENTGLGKKGVSILGAMLDSLTVIPDENYTELCGMISDIAGQYDEAELSGLNERQKELLNTVTGGEFSGNTGVINKMYSRMDKSVHKTNTFTAGISMYSDRIFDYKSTACKNLYGWYMGQGMTTVYVNGDEKTFNDDYWSEADPYKLPGTTVELTERVPASVKNGREYKDGSSFVGGVSGGSYGAAAMAVEPYIISNTVGTGATGTAFKEGFAPDIKIDLSAKKAWFMFDNEIAALGSGITSSDNETVITTIDNRYGSELVSDGGSWLHLSGSGNCGYYFPNGEAASSQKRENGLYELWIDHGAKPNNVSYSYVILPSMTAEETKAYALSPKVKVLANHSTVQAVSYNNGEICGYVFYKPQTFNGITVSEPMIVMTESSDTGIILYVSDPTQSLKHANIIVPGKFTADIPELNSCRTMDDNTELEVNFSDSCGKTIAIELSK